MTAIVSKWEERLNP